MTFGFYPGKSISQENLVSNTFEINFQKNLKALNNMYCWNDPGFFPGKFLLLEVKDFNQEFNQLNLMVFPQVNQEAKDFYAFLEHLPTEEKQNLIRYFSFYGNYFESVFKKAGLPVELKYMAPALSAMNRNFSGPNRKAGLWQLTHFQGILNDLQINRLVDERLNERLSTICYAQLIKQNQKVFNSVELAVLGQWLGNAKIQNAISLAGNKNSYDEIKRLLPDSINQYVAAFQATAVFLSANKFKETVNSLVKKGLSDTVKINRQLHFKQVSAVLKIPEMQLEFLNPQFRFQIVPGNEKVHKLAVPLGFRDDFVIWQDSVYQTFDSTLFTLVTQKIEYPPAPNRQYLGEPVKDLEIEGKTKIQYRLKTGDVLGIIAEKYDVRVADLKYWNNINNERRIQAGRKLDIFVDDDKVDYYQNIENEDKVEIVSAKNGIEKKLQNPPLKVFEDLSSATKIEHIVKSGESPFTIAKKYDGVIPEQILEWNNISDARKIQIGQKLIIYLKK